MISLNNVMGNIRRWKNSIISLRLGFLEIPHKNIWVSWGVLIKGLSIQKGTQTPCWLRPCFRKWPRSKTISLSICRVCSAPSPSRLLRVKLLIISSWKIMSLETWLLKGAMLLCTRQDWGPVNALVIYGLIFFRMKSELSIYLIYCFVLQNNTCGQFLKPPLALERIQQCLCFIYIQFIGWWAIVSWFYINS